MSKKGIQESRRDKTSDLIVGMEEEIRFILQNAKKIAKGEIAEKIELALVTLNRSNAWPDIFMAGYYASWAAGLARRYGEETPLWKTLRRIEDWFPPNPLFFKVMNGSIFSGTVLFFIRN